MVNMALDKKIKNLVDKMIHQVDSLVQHQDELNSLVLAENKIEKKEVLAYQEHTIWLKSEITKIENELSQYLK